MPYGLFYSHENSSGYYRVSAYFIAKILSDILPLRLIPLIPFSILTYFMIGMLIIINKILITVEMVITLKFYNYSACLAALKKHR